jgi:hypothetical protein
VLDDDVELLGRLRLVPAAVEHRLGLVEPAADGIPARRVGQEEHPDEQRDGRDRGDAEHPTPDVRVLDQRVQHGVHRERQELAGDDHQLVDRHHSSSSVRGGHLRQVQRAGGRRGTDAEAEQDPAGGHDPDVGRDGADHGPDQEEAGADQQAALPAQGVGQLPTEQRTERGPREQQRADHQCLGERRQRQVFLHVQQRTGDDPGVVTEQQTTQCRDGGQLDQEAVVGW